MKKREGNQRVATVSAPRDEMEKAASMIGQGRVLTNSLIIASATATAA
ncbi:hypothetical protein [Streptomyces sp. WZ-12]